MSETVEDHPLNIIWTDIVSAFNPRISPRTTIKRNGGSRTGALLYPIGEFRVVSTRNAGGDDPLEDLHPDRPGHTGR